MKTRFLFFLLIPMVVFSQAVKVMSYNIRVDFGGDGANNWEFRREFLAQQLQFYEPDFIGTQEGKAHQLNYIDSTLVDYKYIGISHDNSKTEGEFTAIFYNTKKFKLVHDDNFLLSETPDLKSKKRFYIFNTHLDHIGITARTKSAQLIVEKMRTTNIKNLPLIFTGDFNSEDNTEAYKTITVYLNDTKKISQANH